MNLSSIPRDLKTVIDSERVDFFVKSKRNHPKKKAIAILLFAIFWSGFVSVFVVAFFGPLFKKGEVHFTSNGNPRVASLDNLEDLLFPALLIGLFALVGIAMLIWGISILYQKGGYFVGTESRLIKYRKGTIDIKDWEQFSGNIQIKKNGMSGTIQLELRTGKMQNRKNSSAKFVPDTIFISGINNVFDIEKKCRLRIQENDPTPRIKTDNYS
ncbi:hypothetical protein D1816_17350 [Aquimarina sp. AD10]|uniref:DUF304 domain-containing protein n=1 Tax=Aquimarina aggregata TaxID=1642818 RepID=A0A162ZEA2_9FLAO|nr:MULTISPECIES: hypothetical protein [Aquimarina]AXT62048.1 hypothetical protein D1816_17350 [Aquimarina sp. AD10]KZS39746.1 hypothetical protein AWE51_08840 [Aquimarina aggregata]RKM99964.1 hypothetical protein D7033_10230 [Aquimarina sp. AD10]